MTSTTQTRDQSARLLATENINVIRSNVKTASFDIKNRTLMLPRWQDMSDAEEEMLLLHEVGHALFTGYDEYSNVFEKGRRHLKSYANVLEDVRIERKMKVRYPGSRKFFAAGYKSVNERDFFGVRGANINEFQLIDRINLYYKVGFNCGVKFNEVETNMLRRVDRTETVEEVIALAEEIYAYSLQKQKEEEEAKEKALEKLAEEESGEESGEESEEDGDTYDEDEDGDEEGDQGSEPAESEENDEEEGEDSKPFNIPNDGTQGSDKPELQEEEEKPELDEPTTMRSFDDKLELRADENLIIKYYEPRFNLTSGSDVIVPYTQILKDFRRSEALDERIEWNDGRIKAFKSSSNRIVGYLIKEFEMRKSATAYKRAKVSKLGQLDSRKLYAYKLKDDLFKQVMQVMDGQKHGMIFLLDWSGSMTNCIQETVEQVINLAMFCHRTNIPYQVFAFADGYQHEGKTYQEMIENKTENVTGIGCDYKLSMLELFSSRMSSVEFNTMMSSMLSQPQYCIDKYILNGTPLNEALVFLTTYMGKFIAANQTEKNSLIVLTDGNGGTICNQNNPIKNGPIWEGYGFQGVKRRQKSYLIDTVTKKQYDLENNGRLQTGTLMSVIKDRYNTTNIRFFITTPTIRDIKMFVRDNFDCNSPLYKQIVPEEIVSTMRKTSCVAIDNMPGVDEMYILSSNVKLKSTDVVATSKMNSRQIAKNFTAAMNAGVSSRVVLSKFIAQVA